ncbi:glycosyltransferase [Candidatus Dependentiae bacterium]|nr:glycosyltransferase [Candidatus Dependentiae bacterium]
MRIFYASDTTPNSSFESNLWRNNLYLPLIDLGHDVVEFEYDLRKTFQNLNPAYPKQKFFIKTNRPKISQELLTQIKQAHDNKKIDLFFSYFFDACILPETIDEIKSMGIKTVNWYCNGSYQLNLVSQISPHYDYCLVPEKFRLNDYKKLGATPIYCQEATNPNIYKSHQCQQKFDVTFVGQAYGDRPNYIKHLLDNGIDVRVWGINWDLYTEQSVLDQKQTKKSYLLKLKKLFSREGLYILKNKFYRTLFSPSPPILPKKIIGNILSDQKMIKLYSQSKINLGLSTCGETHLKKNRIMQIRLRDFEVPMAGGFYMTEYMQELEEFFEIGKEIVCYHNKNDLVDKIKYYLKHDNQREKIRRAGQARCLKDHTWHKRFEMVFENVFRKQP